jgi:transposase
MSFRRNAKLGLAGRHALVCAIEDGMTLKTAAAVFSVSPATAHRWWHRRLESSEEARRTLSCLLDRSSRPRRSPRQLAPELAEAICACRRRTGWGPRLVAGATGFCHSTVWKVLKRAGLSRPPRPAREPANRYEWPCPGDLLHMDTSEYARFQRPGHRVTGDRSSQDRQHHDGVDVVHAIIDDHSRLAYAEIHADAKAVTVAGFLDRALCFYAEHGITPRRLMTDNAWAYARSRLIRQQLEQLRIRHLTTKPTGRAPTAKSNASTKRWRANGPTGSSTAHTANAPPHCHTGSTTTTPGGHTARSEANPRSAAFTTYVGRTSSQFLFCKPDRVRRRATHKSLRPTREGEADDHVGPLANHRFGAVAAGRARSVMRTRAGSASVG